MRMRLRRLIESPTETIGALELPDGSELFTLELPWRGNRRNISRIPAGQYRLLDVQGSQRLRLAGDSVFYTQSEGSERFAVDIHVGNRADEIEGCILVGFGVGRPETTAYELTGSARAFADVRKWFDSAAPSPVFLEIRDCF